MLYNVTYTIPNKKTPQKYMLYAFCSVYNLLIKKYEKGVDIVITLCYNINVIKWTVRLFHLQKGGDNMEYITLIVIFTFYIVVLLKKK